MHRNFTHRILESWHLSKIIWKEKIADFVRTLGKCAVPKGLQRLYLKDGNFAHVLPGKCLCFLSQEKKTDTLSCLFEVFVFFSRKHLFWGPFWVLFFSKDLRTLLLPPEAHVWARKRLLYIRISTLNNFIFAFILKPLEFPFRIFPQTSRGLRKRFPFRFFLKPLQFSFRIFP